MNEQQTLITYRALHQNKMLEVQAVSVAAAQRAAASVWGMDNLEEITVRSLEQDKATLIAALRIAGQVARAIQEAGPGGLAEGMIYATLLSAIPSFTLETYQSLMRMLESNNLVRRADGRAYWALGDN